MAEALSLASAGIQRFPGAMTSIAISDELIRIGDMIRAVSPPETCVGFSFDGRLQVHVDVRKREHVLHLEMVLPTLAGGMFDGLSVGSVPGRPFHHRVTATVQA